MLELTDITVRFGKAGTPNAIEHVSLSVKEKEKVFIIGETGSGKSVLLLAVLGMLPKSAHVTGKALLNGRDLMQLKGKALREMRGKEIAYVPQGSGNGMNPLLRIGYQVGEPLMIHQKAKKKAAIREAIKGLREFDLGEEEELVKKYPHMLSGGMKQRSLIAMGVIADAPVIFADEPTKGLDSERIELVIQAFGQLKDQTIVCVTHDLRFARAAAERICVMYASEQIESAAKDEFFAEPLHPYAKAILAALPENGLKVSKGFAPPREDEEAAKGCHYARRCSFCTERCENKPPMVEVGDRKVRCWLYAD